MTAVIDGIRTIPFIPPKGIRYLSINLALALPSDVWQLAESLGFNPNLCKWLTITRQNCRPCSGTVALKTHQML